MGKKSIMQSSSFGFSLVEMSVVVGIVGLLLSIVLISIHLKDSANVNVLLSEQYMYQTAMSNFYKIYRAIPGDMINATTTFGCNPTNRKCENGNGNKMIELSSNNEVYQVWRHLYLAKLISFEGTGVVNGNSRDRAEVGVNVPLSRLSIFDKIGYMVYYPSRETDIERRCIAPMDNSIKSHILKLSDFTQQNECGIGIIGAISSAIMQKMDEKIDDGLPKSGFVRAEQTIDKQCYTERSAHDRYTMKADLASCNALIILTSLQW